MTFDMVDAMADSPKVARHMHLPVQHGSNEMLKKMNRGYTIEHFKELVSYVREKMPDIVLTTDLITGFPGETEEMHQETLALLKEVRFDSAYPIIVEGPSKQENVWYGRTSGNKMILFPYQEGVKVGDILEAKVEVGQTWVLKGKLV